MSRKTRVLRGSGNWPAALDESLAQGPAEAFAWMQAHTRVVKSDVHSRVGLLSVMGQPVYLKFYRSKGLLQRIRFRLGRGRAVAAYDNAVALRNAGVLAPEPLACLLGPEGAFLLTEAIDRSSDLKALWVEGQSGERLARLMTGAGNTLAALHRAGFSHGDCKWSNFLVSGEQIYLIDLEAVAASAAAGDGCTRDLARFTVNAEDMGLERTLFLEFLGTYANALDISVGEISRRIGPRVLALRQRHEKKYGQRGHHLV